MATPLKFIANGKHNNQPHPQSMRQEVPDTHSSKQSHEIGTNYQEKMQINGIS